MICEGTGKVRRGKWARWDAGEPRKMGSRGCWVLALVGRGRREKYEESKADGNSRLKTPLSSRELNSNVRGGRETSADDGENTERRRQMCAHF